MKFITGGYARALNKLADRELGEDYVFCIHFSDFEQFVILLDNAFKGRLIESKTGETYDYLTGTDVTISICFSCPPDHFIIPAQEMTFYKFFAPNLK